jgi:hypothetical protein
VYSDTSIGACGCLLSVCSRTLHRSILHFNPLHSCTQASDVEINVDDTLLTVHINPYFLRLNFSHSLLEDDNSSARYDPSSGYLTLTLTKATSGQEFKDLDLLAKLLAPRTQHARGPMIETLQSESTSQQDADDLTERTEQLSLEQKEILEGERSLDFTRPILSNMCSR